MNETNDTSVEPGRRELLRMGGCSAMAGLTILAAPAEAHAAPNDRPDAAYPLDNPENQIYSACLQCNTGCGIKVKVQDGVVVKIDGNPYDPFNLVPSLPMSTAIEQTARIDAPLCPKGQSGLQTHYDPYRIRHVLKRAGKRGEGNWVSIPFDRAVAEIVEGGKLFANVPGEEDRQVAGLKGLYVLKDQAAYKALGDATKALGKAIAKAKTPEERTKLVEEFKAKNPAQLAALIDADHPDFGPKNNQFVYMWGRKKDGRAQFARRFAQAFGTANAHGHTTVCQGSLYFTGKAMSEQWIVEEKDGKVEGKFDKGDKFYFQIDTENADFVLFVGANLLEANYGPTNRAPRLTERLAAGELKIAVVDPRFSKLASKAAKWYPIKPGTDGALAMALARWMFDKNRIDRTFLGCANAAAAKQAGEACWNNASWLVKFDDKGRPGPFIRAAEFRPEAMKEGLKVETLGEEKLAVFVARVKGKEGEKDVEKFVCFNPDDTKNPVAGDLFVADHVAAQAGGDGLPLEPRKIGSLKLATGLDIFRASAARQTLEQYAAACGIKAQEIEWLAHQLTSHGKKAGIDIHRGVSQHTNGFYNVLAFYAVNALLGNYGWAGGSIKATTYKPDGSASKNKKGEDPPYPLKETEKSLPAPFGINILRHNKYEETTLFAGYPAKRNWWPHATDIYQEILPSIGDQYPYPVKVLMSYMAAAPYSLPAGHTNIAVLRDVEKLPLHFTCDITIGEMSLYADYIFPDLSFLERWEFQGSHPNMPAKLQPIRQPTADFGIERVTVFGETMPCSFEAMMLGLAEKLGLPGFGPAGLGKFGPLNRPEDLYLKMVANIAAEDEPVPDASTDELQLFREARRHFKPEIFTEERWKRTVDAKHWPKIVYLLNRGGRFEDYRADKLFKEGRHSNAYKKLLSLYCEKVAGFKNAFTGKNYAGFPGFIPLSDTLGRPLPEALGMTQDRLEEDYPFTLLTHRVIAMTKSRTISNYWLLALAPENGVLLNPGDARRHGVKNGDRVRIVSATNPEGVWELGPGWTKAMIGRIKLTETIMPGCVSFSLGHGHWAAGSSDQTIDGHTLRADPRRAQGVHANAAMWIDPHLKNTCLLDPIGGSAAFYDTRVRLELA